MERSMSEHPLVVIVGPTASGKTALSLAMAEEFNGEIVNCDSVAVYREFEIGTAKPSADERRQVPHHLIDIVAPNEPFTAGDYSRLAREALGSITERGRLPIVVGGTGLYLRALIDGLFAGPQRSEELREHLRSRAAERGPDYLHKILKKLDLSAAEKIHANDVAKVVRAIEICIAARQPMTAMWKQGRDPLTGYRILRIGLNPERAQLYARINERAARMFDRGLLEETSALVSRYGDDRGAPPLKSLGYKQAMQLLAGEFSREQAVAAAQQGHRNYAKRQLTWFRREPEVQWLDGFGDCESVQRAASEVIREFLRA